MRIPIVRTRRGFFLGEIALNPNCTRFIRRAVIRKGQLNALPDLGDKLGQCLAHGALNIGNDLG